MGPARSKLNVILQNTFKERCNAVCGVNSMGVTVGLLYNLKSDCPISKDEMEDADAEFEDEETVCDIAEALERAKHRVILFKYDRTLARRLEEAQLDIIFNIAEGWEGRNRELIAPALLEMLGIPYTGSDPLTLGVSLDKAMAKTIVEAHKLSTPRFMKVSNLSQVSLVRLEFPLFVKPNCEGSSKGVRGFCKVNNEEELKERVAWLLKVYKQPVIVEEYLPGREFTVGLLGNEELTVFPIMEICSSKTPFKSDSHTSGQIDEDFIYCFETKKKNLERFICPAPLSEELAEKVTDLAIRAYRALECRDLARVDVKLDGNGEPHFLEVNPLPGLSRVSLYPYQASVMGVTFDGLVNGILSNALRRYGINFNDLN
jgi:D-alanine-D-alanine ligase